MCALTFARHQRGFGREEMLSEAGNRIHQYIDTDAGLAGNKVNSFLSAELRFNLLFLLLVQEINFVDHHPSFRSRSDRAAPLRDGGIDNPKHKVCARSLLTRAPHAFAFNGIGRLANAGGIEHRYGIAGEIEMQFEHVAGGSREWRYNRRLAPCEPIE